MRLLTWNIHGGLGMDGRRSIDRIAAQIRDSGAEIVCLQEVHRRQPMSRFQDQVSALREACGFEAVFQPTLQFGPMRFGNLLLSSFPIVAHQLVAVPNLMERKRLAMRFERRGMIAARLETAGGTMTVISGHWGLNSTDRMASAQEIGERVRAEKGAVVVCGDLNAEPQSAEIKLFGSLSGFVDGGAAKGDQTYPSSRPVVRIDYVWCSPDIRGWKLTVEDCQASDHRPLLFEW